MNRATALSPLLVSHRRRAILRRFASCRWLALGLLVLLLVSACNEEADDTTAPGNVSFFRATSASGKVQLTWSNPSDADLTGVVVVRRTDRFPDHSTDGTQVFNALGESYDDTDVVPLQNYYYTAFAYDEVPNYASGARPGTPVASAAVLVSDITFPDNVLRACVDERANTNIVAELTYLDCDGWYGINDLTGMENLTALKTFKMISGTLAQLDPLASLSELTEIMIQSTAVDDVGALKNLSKLETVNLNFNDIIDISSLGNVTTLSKLYLAGNQIVDVSALAALTNLTELRLDFEQNLSGSPSLTTGVADLVSLVNATSINLNSNVNIPCTDLQTLITALNASSTVVSPSATSAGFNCTP